MKFSIQKNVSRSFALFGVFLLVTACGGGGGGQAVTAPVSSTDSFALDKAATNAVLQPLAFSLNAKDGEYSYSALLSNNPQADAVFEGSVTKRSILTLKLQENQSAPVTTLVDRFFSIGPFTIVGSVLTGDPNGQNYMVKTSAFPLPAAAKVGSQGPVFSADYYTDSTKSVRSGSITGTYSLEADTVNTALLCLNGTSLSVSNVVTSTGSTCYRISPDGTVSGLTLDIGIIENGVVRKTLSFR